MAKMTLNGVKTLAQNYVDSAKIAGAWSATTASFSGLIDKIGKQVTIDGLFNDKLQMLDGDNLPFGKTIEEYFIDLTLPTAFSTTQGVYDNTALTTEGAKDVIPALPTVEQAAWSKTLGRQKIKTTVPYDNFERAMLNAEDAGNFTAKITERLANSEALNKYAIKKQLIGRFSDAVYAVNKLEIDKPIDADTGEAFLKAVKEAIEEASFANEKALTSGALIGAAPEMTLFIKKGIIPSLEVDTFAGAFHREDLALNCNIVVVDDFGTQTNSSVYALLCDSRAMKLYTGYKATRVSENADGDFVNMVLHSEYTAFYSKFVYGKVFYKA